MLVIIKVFLIWNYSFSLFEGGWQFEDAMSVVYPMERFEERINLKEFGTYVDPNNSPVSPERFRGYHSGVDAEIFPEEIDLEVPVFAIADGSISLVRDVQGYGGVVVIAHEIEGSTYSALYGHLSLESVDWSVGERVRRGEQIGVLGRGYSEETDGERKHLHFSIVEGDVVVLAGYAESEGGLTRWLDPLLFFDEKL